MRLAPRSTWPMAVPERRHHHVTGGAGSQPRSRLAEDFPEVVGVQQCGQAHHRDDGRQQAQGHLEGERAGVAEAVGVAEAAERVLQQSPPAGAAQRLQRIVSLQLVGLRDQRGRAHDATPSMVTVIGGQSLIANGIKLFVHRERPPTRPATRPARLASAVAGGLAFANVDRSPDRRRDLAARTARRRPGRPDRQPRRPAAHVTPRRRGAGARAGRRHRGARLLPGPQPAGAPLPGGRRRRTGLRRRPLPVRRPCAGRAQGQGLHHHQAAGRGQELGGAVRAGARLRGGPVRGRRRVRARPARPQDRRGRGFRADPDGARARPPRQLPGARRRGRQTGRLPHPCQRAGDPHAQTCRHPGPGAPLRAAPSRLQPDRLRRGHRHGDRDRHRPGRAAAGRCAARDGVGVGGRGRQGRRGLPRGPRRPGGALGGRHRLSGPAVQSPPRPPLLRSRGNRALMGASAATAVLVVAIGTLGTFGMRGWGRVPFSVPSVPWYHAWPYYLFWAPRLDRTWAELVLPVAVLVAAGLVAAAGLVRARRAWLAGSLVGAFALDLAVAALAGGPRAWQAPLAASGEYPRAVPQVGAIPTFLHDFATRVPGLPDYAAQHPPGATLFYVLVARVWPGLGGATVATVAAACLGLLVVAALARDELREVGERWAVVCWALAPAVVLYAATSADAMWAPVLAGAALAAHRGLMRRSLAWTVAGGALLWLASMMTFAAMLLLPFLAVRAIGLAAGQGSKGGSWVVRWAAITTATVLALAALLWLATGYDLVATVQAVNRFWSTAPGTRTRSWLWWSFGDLVAFAAILGVPLTAALVVGVWAALRRRAWWSFEVATLASLLAGALWGHTKGEVERMWQFLVPFAVVVAVRQLLRWRASMPVVAAVLLTQSVLVQLLFFTRW